MFTSLGSATDAVFMTSPVHTVVTGASTSVSAVVVKYGDVTSTDEAVCCEVVQGLVLSPL